MHSRAIQSNGEFGHKVFPVSEPGEEFLDLRHVTTWATQGSK